MESCITVYTWQATITRKKSIRQNLLGTWRRKLKRIRKGEGKDKLTLMPA